MGLKALREALGCGCTAQQRLKLGGFLSGPCGDFDAAREELILARDALEGRERGDAASLIAFNEVRYWDSRRDWRDLDALQLLLESSEEAVQLLRPPTTIPERMALAQALTRYANGAFKAACVSDADTAVTWEVWLDRSTAATDEVQAMLARCPPSGVLGRALLVAGVATMVRGNKRKLEGKPHRKIQVMAARLFQTSEVVLQQSVGPLNESSMYTHGNLGEFFIQDAGDLTRGLLGLHDGCVVGLKLLGKDHPNVKSKLHEFSSIMRQLGIRQLADYIDQGKLHFRERLETLLRANTTPVDLEAWANEDPAGGEAGGDAAEGGAAAQPQGGGE